MRTTFALLVSLLCAAPSAAHANGLSLEMGIIWVAPQEPSLRAVDDRSDAMSTIGLGGAWTLGRLGDLRLDALAAWGVGTSEASLGSDIRTDLLEHGFALGARVRWARFFFAQPFVSLRAGPALGWLDVRGAGDLESFDMALRVEPAAGIEAFFPFSGLSRRLPHPLTRVDRKSGWAGAGIGVSLDVGYRFQSAYRFDGEPPEPEDDDEAADALPRTGPTLGRLTLSGIRMGIDVNVRF